MRLDVRLAVTRAPVDEGHSAPEIGELFGVSRQLASRFVGEARRGEADGRTGRIGTVERSSTGMT